MTAKKDLKRRVRERQGETGESYVTARRQVLTRAGRGDEPTDRPAAIAVEEMLDLEAQGARLGLRCRILMTASLARRVEPGAVLERVRDVLLATEDDPGTLPLRAAVLFGQTVRLQVRSPRAWLEDAQRFVTRVRAGLGGVSDSGTMMALDVAGRRAPVTVIAHVGWRRAPRPPVVPRLILSAVDDRLTRGDLTTYAFLP